MPKKVYRVKPVLLEDVRIGLRRFAGKADNYNKEGERDFAIFLEPEKAEELGSEGWNVKWFPQRDPDEDRQAFLKVAVAFRDYPPRVAMISSRGQTMLNENTIHLLDVAELDRVDLTLNPYEWTVNGKSGIKAYLKSMYVTLREDELSKRYRDIPSSDEPPFVPDARR